MKADMKLSIVILNYNGSPFLGDVLDSVLEEKFRDREVVVVDNASTDDSLQILQKYEGRIRLIVNSENLGFAEGNNVGIRAAEGEYVFLLNNDARLKKGTLSLLVDYLDNRPHYGAVQPKILSWKQPDEFEYAGGGGGFIDKYGYPFARGRILYNVEKDAGQYDDNIELFWASGAAIMFRKELTKSIGLLDSDFFLHQEEIDFCWRMHLAGYKVGFAGEAVVYHHGGGSLGYESPFKLYLNYRNNLNMLIKNMRKRAVLKILFLRVVLDSGAFTFKLLKGQWAHAMAILRGYVSVLIHLPQTLNKRNHVKKHIAIQDNSAFDYLVYQKSIILSYFFGKKHTFSSLNMTPHSS